MMLRPPIPKNEKPSVTIANLERVNDNLAARIDELSQRKIDLELQMTYYRDQAKDAVSQINMLGSRIEALDLGLEDAQAKIAKLESVLCGYRQAIADVHGHGGEIK